MKMLLTALFLFLCCGGVPLPLTTHAPHEDEVRAIAAVEDSFEAAGFPIDVGWVNVTWYEGRCLLHWSVDTSHWTIRNSCVKGLAITCDLQVVWTEKVSQGSLAHEMMHCALFQHGDYQWYSHHQPEWGMVAYANDRLRAMGL